MRSSGGCKEWGVCKLQREKCESCNMDSLQQLRVSTSQGGVDTARRRT